MIFGLKIYHLATLLLVEAGAVTDGSRCTVRAKKICT
jgi:hypothetical protein